MLGTAWVARHGTAWQSRPGYARASRPGEARQSGLGWARRRLERPGTARPESRGDARRGQEWRCPALLGTAWQAIARRGSQGSSAHSLAGLGAAVLAGRG